MKKTTILLALTTALLAAAEPTRAAAPVKVQPASAAVKVTVRSLSLKNADFLQALETLARKGRVKMEVDWTALKSVGVEKRSKVTVVGRKLTIAQLLDMTLARVAGARSPLGWYISGANIRITTQAAILGAGPTGPLFRPAAGTKKPQPATPARPPRRRAGRLTLDFDETPAQEVVEFFRSRYRLNLVAHWNSLETVGVFKDTPVTLKITQPIPLSRALDLFVDTFNGAKGPLEKLYWRSRGGVYTITTGEVLDRNLSTRVLDVADMLMVTPNFVGPRLSVQRRTASGDDSGDDSDAFGDDSDSSFGNAAGSAGSTDQQRAQRRATLIEVVRNAIGDEFWSPTGRGSIRIVKGKMIITQSELGFMLLDRSLRGRLR